MKGGAWAAGRTTSPAAACSKPPSPDQAAGSLLTLVLVAVAMAADACNQIVKQEARL